MKAHELLSDAKRFTTGTLARDTYGKPCGIGPAAIRFDCLGALLKCHPDSAKREPIAKALFTLCQARHGHKRLGRLNYDDALSLLKDCDA